MGKKSSITILIILLVSSIFLLSSCDLLMTSSTTSANSATISNTSTYPPAPEDFDNWAELSIKWAKGEHENMNYSGYCLRFVSEAFGLGENINQNTTGWNSPLEVKNGLDSRFISSSQGLNPPRGSLVFFSASGYYHYPDDGTINLAEYGHIGIYLDDNQVIHAFGAVDIQSIAEVEDCSGTDSEGNVFQIDSYIGWAYPPDEWRPLPTPIYPGTTDSPGPIIDTLTPIFQWDSISNADYFGLYIRNLDTDTIVFDSQERNIFITGASYTLPAGVLELGKHYCWNMRDHNSAGWRFYSERLYFQTEEIDAWRVDDDLNDYPNADFTTIQEAINTALFGDTILVYPGTYVENINVNKDNLTIKSKDGADLTIIQASNINDHTIEIKANNVNISGLTIQGATGNNKAGIYSYDYPLSVSDLILLNNYYGIYAYSTSQSPLRVSGSSFLENNCGVYSQSSLGDRYGEVHVSDSSFSKNTYGVYTSDFCGVDVSNSNFSSNNYGIFGHERMSIGAEHSTFSNNTYGIYGDSIWGINSSHSDFCDNDYGIYDINGWDNTLSISYSNIQNNGLGIYYKASTESSHIIFLNNFIDNTSDFQSSISTYIFYSRVETNYVYNSTTYMSFLGNYWDNYSGIDANGDGIGDTPHSMGKYQDLYPLIEPIENYIINT